MEFALDFGGIAVVNPVERDAIGVGLFKIHRRFCADIKTVPFTDHFIGILLNGECGTALRNAARTLRDLSTRG